MYQFLNLADENFKLVTLDDACKRHLKRALELSKVKESPEEFIMGHSFKEICDMIKNLPYFIFDEKLLIKRIAGENKASHSVSPFIVARIDGDTCGVHLITTAVPERDDEIIHTLPFSGNNNDGKNEAWERFLNYCAKHHWYTMGLSLFGERPDCPPTIVYGVDRESAEEEYRRLCDGLGIES